jgi:hypothetical protein
MVQFIPQYVIAIVGIVVGASAGWIAAAVLNRKIAVSRRIDRWDAGITIPLLLGAAGAHLALVPVVELQRQLMFGLYVLVLIVLVAMAVADWRVWRLGAVLFPLGSILAYGFFAVQAREADVVGLAVKFIELAAIVAALWPVIWTRRRPSVQRQRIPRG